MEDLLRVGVITSPHGIQGACNVFSTTDEPELFGSWKTLWLKKKNGMQLVHPLTVQYQKNMVILKFQEYSTRDEAETLRQAELYIERSQAAPCEEQENFIADLIGLRVVTDEGEELGSCTEVYQTGANDVYEITLKSGQQVLFPAIRQCILQVDLEKKEMLVHVLEGLL